MSEHEPERTISPDCLPMVHQEALDERAAARLTTDREFSAFYRTTNCQLVAFLINQGATLPIAADIAQDTMTKAYRRWSEIGQPRAWVHTVASRALIRAVASVCEEPYEQVPEPTSLLPRPDAAAEWEAHYDALEMLRSLPPRQRQILAWTMSDFMPSEIAELLGMTPNTVSANLKKARRAAAAYRKAREEQ